MAAYTYFIISPGAEENSFIDDQDDAGTTGNYIKFGDQRHDQGEQGVRVAYLTHNPDIGIAAVMDSTVFQDPRLGKSLMNYIVGTLDHPPVGGTEWAFVPDPAAEGILDLEAALSG